MKMKKKIKIFIDGACSGNPGTGGYAVVVCKEDKCEKLFGYEIATTNNRMELRAAIEALKHIALVLSKEEMREFDVISDSAYVVNAVEKNWLLAWKFNNWKTSKGSEVKNKDLWEEFVYTYELAKSCGCNVNFVKVKGHAGNSYNELADKIAKEQAQEATEVLCKIRSKELSNEFC